MIFLPLAGRTLQYYEFGPPDGHPTVLVHGMLATGRRFQWWEHEFEAYNIRAICPTLPGWGLSDPLPDRSVSSYPDDIRQLMDHLGVQRFDVMGVSFGGMHAAAVAAKLGHRVMRCGLFGRCLATTPSSLHLSTFTSLHRFIFPLIFFSFTPPSLRPLLCCAVLCCKPQARTAQTTSPGTM
jgi:pimeloyl-ACP methyl ester carboxylesterase